MAKVQPYFCYIIVRNLFTWTKAMVEYLDRIPRVRPIILDNQSSYPPLLDWYKEKPCSVFHLGANYGLEAPWSARAIERWGNGRPYFVTDPDLDLSGVPEDFVHRMLELHTRYPGISKVGLSLRIDDLPDTPVGVQARQWEQKFWVNQKDADCYAAPVDTTFAMYKKTVRSHCYDAVRMKPPYMARHLPWYATRDTVTDEYRYYLANVATFSHWGAALSSSLK